MTKPAASSPSSLMTGFKQGFGEIINLVSEASEKTSPWVKARIEKMSKKAQDEIYGRFNDAFNDGVKNAEKGRKHYESSLDFPALAQKTTEVADDIELADQINRLFQKNAQIKTIHEQYKKLSASARKEIEKHLGSTAEKAQPKELQKALITVFNGMGRLDLPADFGKSLLEGTKIIENDLRLANANKNLIAAMIPEFKQDTEYQNRTAQVREVYQKLSVPARIIIEQILIKKDPLGLDPSKPWNKTFGQMTVNSAKIASGEQLRSAIHTFFDLYLSHDDHYIQGSKEWKLEQEKALIAKLYMATVSVIREALPAFGSDMPIVSEEEFQKNVKSQLQKADLNEWEKVCVAYAMYMSGLAFGEEKRDLFNVILDPEISIEDSLPAFNKLLDQDKLAIGKIFLDTHQVPIEQAKKDQLVDATKKHAESLLERWEADCAAKAEALAQPVQKAPRTKAEKNFLCLSLAFKQDYTLLKKNERYFQTPQKDSDDEVEEKQRVLAIYKDLSPYGQLLAEQCLISTYPDDYSCQPADKKDKMDATVELYSSIQIKTAMALLFHRIAKDSKQIRYEDFRMPSSIPDRGWMERAMLQEYLDHPRTLALASLESDPNRSTEDFEEAILKQVRGGLPEWFQKLEQIMSHYWLSHQQTLAHTNDYQILLGLGKYLYSTTPIDKETFLQRYYKFTNETKFALDFILQREHKVVIGGNNDGATLEQLKASYKSLVLAVRAPLLITRGLFSRTDFLDRVIAPLFEA